MTLRGENFARMILRVQDTATADDFLASDNSCYVNGETLVLDAGILPGQSLTLLRIMLPASLTSTE